jgi:hypothetical protein
MISHGTKVSNVDQLVQQRTQLVNKQLWQNVARLLGVGAGAGLAARGAQGVYNIGRKAMSNPNTLSPITVTVPAHEEEEKLAFFDGSQATSWTGHPLAIPLGVAATGAGTLGGWKAMDYVLDRRRKQQMKDELDNVKQQYEQALLSAYDKKASDLGKDLDRLFELLEGEKQAGVQDVINAIIPPDVQGKAVGMGMAGAGAIGLISGLVTHNIAGKRRRQALLTKALRKRRREQALVQPTRIYAIPQPMAPTTSMNTAPTEDDLNGNPLDKAASYRPRNGVPQSLVPGAR